MAQKPTSTGDRRQSSWGKRQLPPSELVQQVKNESIFRLRDKVIEHLHSAGFNIWDPDQDKELAGFSTLLIERTIAVLHDNGEFSGGRRAIPSSQRDFELKALAACAKRFEGFRILDGAVQFHSLFSRTDLETLSETGRCFPDVKKDWSAFFALEQFLLHGPGEKLPEFALEWIAFRRLFLNLCEQTVPAGCENDWGAELWTQDWKSVVEEAKRLVVDRLDELSGLTLQCVRQRLIEGKELPRGATRGAFGEVCRQFMLQDRLDPSGEDDDSLSIQGELRRVLRITHPEFDKEFLKARTSARRLTFDQLFRFLVKGHATKHREDPCFTVGGMDLETRKFGWVEARQIEQSAIRSAIRRDPFDALMRDDCLEYVVDNIANVGSTFVNRLGRDLLEAERSKSGRIPTDPILDCLASSWVENDCPLWLMTNEAMLNAGRSIGQADWSKDKLGRRLREGEFHRSPVHVITGVQTSARKITAFEVARAFADKVGFSDRYEIMKRPKSLGPRVIRRRKTM